MDVKISELASATTLDDNDVLCGVNGGETKKFTLKRIKDFIGNTIAGDFAKKEHTHSSLYNGAYTVSIPSTIKKNDEFMLRSEKTAENIDYNNKTSKLSSINVQDAIDELSTKAGSGKASGVSYDSTASGYDATNVQDAIDSAASAIKKIRDDRGKPDGYASLDSNGEVPEAQLPKHISAVSISVKNMTLSITATVSKE